VIVGVEGAGRQGRRILDILEHYFDIPLAAGDPLLQEVEARHIPGGAWLMRQGDPGESLYFLVHGRLQAWAAEGDDPRARFLNEIVPGDSVGELSLLTGAPRTLPAVRTQVPRARPVDGLAQGHRIGHA